ncbi:MAG: hypothetical protein KC609_26365 [Myxococcales bacterium]|nr:hypothetical protein [Myxococcales bacterium]
MNELTQRVLYSLFRAAARTARHLEVPMRDFIRLAELAYYHEQRAQGLTMRELSERLTLSMRKIALLSKELKQNFFDPERQHDLPRRIEFMLWAEPLSHARIVQALPELPRDEIDDAIERLRRDGRIESSDERTPRLRLTTGATRLQNEALWTRLGGLNSLVSNLAHTVLDRFFRREPRSLARTLALRVRQADQHRLAAFYEGTIWPFFRELDRAATDAGDDPTVSIAVSYFYGPYEFQGCELVHEQED